MQLKADCWTLVVVQWWCYTLCLQLVDWYWPSIRLKWSFAAKWAPDARWPLLEVGPDVVGPSKLDARVLGPKMRPANVNNVAWHRIGADVLGMISGY